MPGYSSALRTQPFRAEKSARGAAKNVNNFAGTQTVEEAAREPVRLALLGADGPTGTDCGIANV